MGQARLLLRVLAVDEFFDERHVFVESVRDFDACAPWGGRQWPASSGPSGTR